MVVRPPAFIILGSGDNAARTDVALVGGKGAKLLELASLSLPVPNFFAVTSDACRKVVEQGDSVAALFTKLDAASHDERSLTDLAERIQRAIVELPFPAEMESSLRVALDRLGEGFVAVRSSAVDEDGADSSFAGQHDSYLFQRGFTQVAEAIRRVWASAYNPRALAYRRQHGGQSSFGFIPMAVVVQQMIDARASGVAFTCHPATYDTRKVVVSSLFGAGEGLVSGGLEADTFVVDKETRVQTIEAATKCDRMVFDDVRGIGLRREALPIELRERPSLASEEVSQVATCAEQIENHFGRPQDIEFCFDAAGKFYLLQARPVASVPEYGPAAGFPLLWDNSNIIESYSGVTSPMTFSFIRRAYTIVYHCFSEVMGIPDSVVRANRSTFENMLGLIKGRVYYNLKNWYRLIRLFPGYEYNSRFMESMMGVNQSFVLEQPPAPAGFYRRWFVEFPRLLRLLVRSLWNFARIRTIVAKFETNFRECYNRWDALDFAALKPHELMALYTEMEDSLLWNWKAPIINDFYVMVYFGLLRKLCKNWCDDATDSLQNELVCGEPGVESAEPARMLLRLAQKAQLQTFLKQAILEQPATSLPALVAQREDCCAFQAEMDRYLALYGFRCMNELKLEEFSLRDRPYVVYQMLRNYLALDDAAALDVAAMTEREHQIRVLAEGRAAASLATVSGRFWKRPLFSFVLKRARLGMKNRENMRFARTRIYGLVRELLRSMGKQFADERILAESEDVFYLTIDEVWDYIKGTAVTTRLAPLAQFRRQEFDTYRSDQHLPAERYMTHGMVYHKNCFQPADEIAPAANGALRGIGVCAGEVTAVAKIVRDPSDDVTLSREILVAERTDPGWVPLYPAVSGILIERGSVLSHSAVVAREMGIPTIVGIRGLLQIVGDGDVVRMDGRSGQVDIVTAANAASTPR
jgi:phosphohistidine swiveling domain-containing protein